MIELKSHDGKAVAEILPEFGGRLNRLVLAAGKYSYDVLNSLKPYDSNYNDRTYNNAILAPFPNRIKNGLYCIEGKRYQLPINDTARNNAVHGLIHDKAFDVKGMKITEHGFEISLSCDYDKEISGYPFAFNLVVVYAVAAGRFTCTARVTNTGDVTCPFGYGFHPYLKLAGGRETWRLAMPECLLVEVDEQMIPTGQVQKMYEQIIDLDDRLYNHCFQLLDDVGTRKVRLQSKTNPVNIELEFGAHEFQYCHIYTPKNDKQLIAIEPMTCNIDGFNNKMGLALLEPGQTFTTTYSISVFV